MNIFVLLSQRLSISYLFCQQKHLPPAIKIIGSQIQKSDHMNFGKNPFSQQPINEASFSPEDIMDVIRSLNNSRVASCPKKQSDEIDKSENKVPQKHAFSHQIRNRLFDQQIDEKRINIPLAFPIMRKKIKPECQYDQCDINLGDSQSNKRITDYFRKHVQNRKQCGEMILDRKIVQKIQVNPIIKNLSQKIAKKRKSIHQYQQQVERMLEKESQKSVQNQTQLQIQRQTMIKFLIQKYKVLIYEYMINEKSKKHQKNSNEKYHKYIEYLNSRILTLEQQKKKKNNKQDNVQSNHILEYYGTDRINYMKEWKKKLQNQKTLLQKQIIKKTSFYNLDTKQSYYQLPSIFLSNNRNPIVIFDKILPLYAKSNSDDLQNGLQIKSLHLQTLCEINLEIIPFSKHIKPERKILMIAYLQRIFNQFRSKQQMTHSVLTPFSFFCNSEDHDILLIGHNAWPEKVKKVTLADMIRKYESFNQSISKYIIRNIGKAVEQIKQQCNIVPFLLPQNIIFNQKNQIKIDCWVKNQLYRFPQFHDFLWKQDQQLYFSPQSARNILQGNPLQFDVWPIGVIMFEIIYGKKPFQYSKKSIDPQEFYIINELQFPSKPIISEGAKDFIKSCLNKPQQRININKILKHYYFDNKK